MHWRLSLVQRCSGEWKFDSSNLFRPKVETIETSLEIPFFNQVTQLLLEYQKELMANF